MREDLFDLRRVLRKEGRSGRAALPCSTPPIASTPILSTSSPPGSTGASWCCAPSIGRPRRISSRRSSATRRSSHRRTGTTCGPDRAAGPAVLRLLPPGARRRAADLRGGGTHRGDRARHRTPILSQERKPCRRARRPPRSSTRSRTARRGSPASLRQLPDQAGGRGSGPRDPEPEDLRHALARTGLRSWLARERRSESPQGLTAEDVEALHGLDVPGWQTDKSLTETVRKALIPAAAAYFLRAKNERGRPPTRGAGSISATAPGWSGSTSSATCPTRDSRSRTG